MDVFLESHDMLREGFSKTSNSAWNSGRSGENRHYAGAGQGEAGIASARENAANGTAIPLQPRLFPEIEIPTCTLRMYVYEPISPWLRNILLRYRST